MNVMRDTSPAIPVIDAVHQQREEKSPLLLILIMVGMIMAIASGCVWVSMKLRPAPAHYADCRDGFMPRGDTCVPGYKRAVLP